MHSANFIKSTYPQEFSVLQSENAFLWYSFSSTTIFMPIMKSLMACSTIFFLWEIRISCTQVKESGKNIFICHLICERQNKSHFQFRRLSSVLQMSYIIFWGWVLAWWNKLTNRKLRWDSNFTLFSIEFLNF